MYQRWRMGRHCNFMTLYWNDDWTPSLRNGSILYPSDTIDDNIVTWKSIAYGGWRAHQWLDDCSGYCIKHIICVIAAAGQLRYVRACVRVSSIRLMMMMFTHTRRWVNIKDAILLYFWGCNKKIKNYINNRSLSWHKKRRVEAVIKPEKKAPTGCLSFGLLLLCFLRNAWTMSYLLVPFGDTCIVA